MEKWGSRIKSLASLSSSPESVSADWSSVTQGQIEDVADFNSAISAMYEGNSGGGEEHFQDEDDSGEQDEEKNSGFLFQSKLYLHLNFVCNSVFASIVFLVNAWVLIHSQSPMEAILNSVALAFIIDVGDLLKDKWENDRKENELAINFHDFIMRPSGWANYQDLMVTKRINQKEVSKGSTRYQYSNDDKRYVVFNDDRLHQEMLEDGLSVVTVFCGQPTAKQTLTTDYVQIDYIIAGMDSRSFVESLCDTFDCKSNYEDLHD